VYTRTHIRVVNELIYTCRGVTVSQPVSQHYATVTRRVKFTWISLVRRSSSEIYLSRLHARFPPPPPAFLSPIVNRVIQPALSRGCITRFREGDDRVKLSRARARTRAIVVLRNACIAFNREFIPMPPLSALLFINTSILLSPHSSSLLPRRIIFFRVIYHRNRTIARYASKALHRKISSSK